MHFLSVLAFVIVNLTAVSFILCSLLFCVFVFRIVVSLSSLIRFEVRFLLSAILHFLLFFSLYSFPFALTPVSQSWFYCNFSQLLHSLLSSSVVIYFLYCPFFLIHTRPFLSNDSIVFFSSSFAFNFVFCNFIFLLFILSHSIPFSLYSLIRFKSVSQRQLVLLYFLSFLSLTLFFHLFHFPLPLPPFTPIVFYH